MDKQKYQEIYDNAKKNSIGNDKKDSNKRTKKKVRMMITIPVLVATLTAASVVGIVNSGFNSVTTDQVEEIDPDNYIYNKYGSIGYELYDYGAEKMENRLKENSILPEYYGAGANHYNFTQDDIDKLGDLSDVDMFCLDELVDDESMNQVYKLTGYKDEDDYLKKNGFVTSKGKADSNKWQNKFLLAMDKIYEKEVTNKVVSK